MCQCLSPACTKPGRLALLSTPTLEPCDVSHICAYALNVSEDPVSSCNLVISSPIHAGVTALDVSEGPMSTEDDLDCIYRTFPGLRSLSMSGVRCASCAERASRYVYRAKWCRGKSVLHVTLFKFAAHSALP